MLTEVVDKEIDYGNTIGELEEVRSSYTQWGVYGNIFKPHQKTTPKLPPGYYSIGADNSSVYLQKEKVNLNKLIKLPNDIHKAVIDEVKRFWDGKDKYNEYGEVYRTNILMHSAPGLGKSSLINIIIDDLIRSRGGFVISLTSTTDLSYYPDAMRIIREIEPNRPVITIIEDIDNFMGGSNETRLLNILDGIQQFDNVVTIATTNYPETLSSRYLNRPTRFGLVIEYPHPDDQTREFFIKNKIKPKDLKKIDLKKWVKNTKGFTVDHINSVIKLVFVSGFSEEQAFGRINTMIEKDGVVKNESKGKGKKKIGFSGDVESEEEIAYPPPLKRVGF